MASATIDEKAPIPSSDISSNRNAAPELNTVVDADDHASAPKAHRTIIENARAAAAKEQQMSLMQGIKLYPKAIAWSMLISTCIVMEGYDISLVSNFCNYDRPRSICLPES